MPPDAKKLRTLVESLVRPSVRLVLAPVDDESELEVTQSKFGGLPYLDDDMWPRCSTCEKGLMFICQLNLPELAPELKLPFDLFSFFYCQECLPMSSEDPPGQWAIRTSKLPGGKAKAPEENGCEDEIYRCVACAVSGKREQSLPGWEDEGLPEQVSELSEKLDPDEPWEPYHSVVESIVGEPNFDSHLGGYAHWIQGGESFECPECGEPLSLFFEIGSEEHAELMWGDGGSVYLFHCPKHPMNFTFCHQCH